jgi:hypothetical protein
MVVHFLTCPVLGAHYKIIKKICEIYAHFGEKEKEAWYKIELARQYVRREQFEQAKCLLLHSYKISKNVNYQKGIGVSLLGIADFLEHQGRYAQAYCCLYRANGSSGKLALCFTLPQKVF